MYDNMQNVKRDGAVKRPVKCDGIFFQILGMHTTCMVLLSKKYYDLYMNLLAGPSIVDAMTYSEINKSLSAPSIIKLIFMNSNPIEFILFLGFFLKNVTLETPYSQTV